MQVEREELIYLMEQVIEKFLKPKFIELGMNATGDWLNSLKAGTEPNRGIIKGKHYTAYLVRGRAGGTRPPIRHLARWVQAKFKLAGQEATSVAFAVAKKIEKEGTEYYPNGTDLLEILQSNEVKHYIEQELKSYLIDKVTLQLTRELQNTFK